MEMAKVKNAVGYIKKPDPGIEGFGKKPPLGAPPKNVDKRGDTGGKFSGPSKKK
jgi:hypothetical protein